MEALSWRWLHYFYTFLPGSPSRIVQQNRGVTGVVSLLVVGTCLSLLAASSVAARASAAVKSEYYENPVADAPAPDPGESIAVRAPMVCYVYGHVQYYVDQQPAC